MALSAARIRRGSPAELCNPLQYRWFVDLAPLETKLAYPILPVRTSAYEDRKYREYIR